MNASGPTSPAATIATLGLLIIVHGVIIGWRDVTRGAQSFFGVPRVTDLVTAAAFCVVALFLARLYRDSSSGLRLRAGRENAIAAGAVGVRIRWERLISFVLSAAIMALAGAMLARSTDVENGGGRSSSHRAAKERPLAGRAFRAWSASGICFAVDGRRWIEWTFSRVRT